jgi:WD40 repeat protein
VAFSPDGKTLAAGYAADVNRSSGGVVLWDTTAGEQRGAPLAVGEGGVSSLAFSPDGNTLAAGYYCEIGARRGVVLWDVAGGNRRGVTLAVGEGNVKSVAFSRDGNTLAAGYAPGLDNRPRSGGVVLWDAASRLRLGAPLTVDGEWVYGMAFSQDGTLAAVYHKWNGGGGVVLFALGLDSWISLAGKAVNRNLTFAEWKQYFPDEREYHRTFRDLPDPHDLPRADAKE